MLLYLLFNTISDDCTYSFDEFIEAFEDDFTAQYVTNELNEGKKFPTFYVKSFASFDNPNELKVEALITQIKNRFK